MNSGSKPSDALHLCSRPVDMWWTGHKREGSPYAGYNRAPDDSSPAESDTTDSVFAGEVGLSLLDDRTHDEP